MKPLKEMVTVERRFQRSIRLDTDITDPEALRGFVCPPTFAHALRTLAEQVRDASHGAFTWTGPFGGGKSSLAVVLSALLSGPGKARKTATEAVGKPAKAIVDAIKPGRAGYRSVAVVGRKQDCAQLIADALRRDGLIRQDIDASDDGGQAVLHALLKIARRPKHTGLVLFIDEMGKVLEGAAQGTGDLHFLQELAELASRSDRQLIVIGILHQAFGEYTGRLAKRTRDEWMKIQGRFVDIPLATMADEQLALLSHAIQVERAPSDRFEPSKALGSIIQANRSSAHKQMADYIAGCWPLNPVTACLLGPYSRRRFGQNQRSIFSFLNSSEPNGFQEFLAASTRKDTYTPARFWDYLRMNLEPSILASPDGHRWATAIEALDRCEARGGSGDHLMVAKTIAVIDQFREHTGFYPSLDVLKVATADISSAARKKILKDLEAWSIAVYRRHIGAYAIHAGSDFEIEAAISEEREGAPDLDFDRIRDLAGLQPIVAKRHYFDTGAMFWMDVNVVPVSEIESRIKRFNATPGTVGLFILALPSDDLSDAETTKRLKVASKTTDTNVVVGLPDNGQVLLDLAQEVAALERIRASRVELSGDAVARREVDARLMASQHALQSRLFDSFLSMRWYAGGKAVRLDGLADVHRFASDIAASVYSHAPLIRNELLNRTKPSSTAVAARRVLMKAMVDERGAPRLGIEGYPAEGGLFASLLESTGLYCAQDKDSSRYAFNAPPKGDDSNLFPLWQRTDELLEASNGEPVSFLSIAQVWREKPFGVREGLIPLLLLAYTLSRMDRLAVYLDGAFRSSIDDFLVDRMNQELDAVQIRKMDFGKLRTRVLEGIGDLVTKYDDGNSGTRDPLIVARRLVSVVVGLPSWTKRTMTLSEDSSRLRSIVANASDPHRFLFDDLPGFAAGSDKLSANDITCIVTSIRNGLDELVNAYQAMCENLQSLMLDELNVKPTKAGWQVLQQRAKLVFNLTGDFRLDAFASRLTEYDGSIEAIEGVASLAANKPPRDWVDRDLDVARLEIAQLAQKFNQAEVFARVKGRDDYQHAVGFVVGMPGAPKPIVEQFAISGDESSAVSDVADQVRSVLTTAGVSERIALAALARVGSELATTSEDTKPMKRVS